MSRKERFCGVMNVWRRVYNIVWTLYVFDQSCRNRETTGQSLACSLDDGNGQTDNPNSDSMVTNSLRYPKQQHKHNNAVNRQ
jgi:hypothetical protein